MGFYSSIYNDVSPAHQHYNFLRKSRLGTWYSIEDVYQIKQHEPMQSHLHVSEGASVMTSACALESRRWFDFVFELSERPIKNKPPKTQVHDV